MSTAPATVMPPCDTSARLPDRVLAALSEAVGEANVLAGPAIAGHVDPYSFLGAKTLAPAAVALPGSTAEVQAIVRIAADHGVPVWPVSAGRNYAYGGASPRVPGSLVIDLRRMNRVLSVDEECGVAVIEPGVTFMELAAHLRATDSGLMASVPDIGWGSVIGNALERGIGYTPYGDHAAMLCGMEVVLASGEVVRTGMAAMDNSPAAHLYKGGFGPSVDGLFQQSNLGIVTQAGVWLMPRPRQYAICSVKVPRAPDIAPLIDAIRPLLLDGTIQSNASIGNAAVVAAVIGNRADFTASADPLDDAAVAQIMQRFRMGYWNGRFGLYGTEALVAARLASVREAIATVPDAQLDVQVYDGSCAVDEVQRPDRGRLGIPSLDMVRIAGWRGGQPAHTDFSLILPPTGRAAIAASTLLRETITSCGFDFASGFTIFPRHMISLSLLAFDRDNEAEAGAVAQLIPELIRKASAIGAAPYRSHLAFMDLTAEQFGAGNGALQRLTAAIKAAVDPKGIIAPGKQGIWTTSHPRPA